MRKKFKGIEISLVVAISLLILALPAYIRCTHLAHTKFVSSDLSFENPVQEEGIPDNQKELKVYGAITFLIMFLLVNKICQTSFPFPQASSARQRIIILRC